MTAEQQRLYDIWLELGNVLHVLGNHGDAAAGAEMLEPIVAKIEELWRGD